MEVVVDALELEQHRPGGAQLAVGLKREGALDRVCVGDGVGDRAGGARALAYVSASPSVMALGCALEAAVLVEEARVHREDPLADDVEAEVPGLDHAGVDRADRDLVDAVAADRGHPLRGVVGVR